MNKLCVVLTLLLASGCAEPYWRKDRDLNPEEIVTLRVPTHEALAARCLRPATMSADACAFPGERVCYVILGPRADACLERHERAHCRGWVHGRLVVPGDCGPTTLRP